MCIPEHYFHTFMQNPTPPHISIVSEEKLNIEDEKYKAKDETQI